MNSEKKDILGQNLEIPEIVWKKADVAFSQIHAKEHKENEDSYLKGKSFFISWLPRVAAVAVICCLVFGTTVAAMEISNLYRRRMEDIQKQEIENLYQLANAGEANSLNRPYTAEERERYQALSEEYEKNGRFPEGALTILSETDSYSGQNVAFDVSTRTIYLPEESMSDEELLEIIDFNHKMAYSIYEKNQERILAQGDYESRLAAMTDDEIDRIYLAYCASKSDIGGGYSREFSLSESQRFEKLKEQYENEGVYSETELTIIKALDEYMGNGIAFCEENSQYCLPEGELSDSELLQIIDFDHKVSYCFDRINYEIQIGLRENYPGTE